MGRMRAFYLAYSIYPQAVGKLEELPVFNIPWGHNIAIFEGVKSLEERLWYANMVIQEGWSRNALMDSIKIKTYQRHGKAITNFHDRLPSPHSKLAHDTLKDPNNDYPPRTISKGHHCLDDCLQSTCIFFKFKGFSLAAR
jgi:hypothetical protein